MEDLNLGRNLSHAFTTEKCLPLIQPTSWLALDLWEIGLICGSFVILTGPNSKLDKGRRTENIVSSETHPSLCLPPHSWAPFTAFPRPVLSLLLHPISRPLLL